MSSGSIVVIHCGYTESSRACLGTAFGSNETYETEREALESLAGWLLKKKKIEDRINKPYLKPCCEKIAGKPNFCSVCGTSLLDKPFDEMSFAYYIARLCCGTADGWGYGWGEPLFEYDPETSQETMVTPDWDVTSLFYIHENWDRVIFLHEHGEEHLAAYANYLETGAEPKIPKWYTMSGFNKDE